MEDEILLRKNDNIYIFLMAITGRTDIDEMRFTKYKWKMKGKNTENMRMSKYTT